MQITTVLMERISFVSTKPFNEIIEKLAAAVGQPDIHTFHNSVAEAKTISEIEMLVRRSVGASELMEFARFDAGEIVNKEPNQQNRRIIRLIVGNPIIMKEMAKIVPDAAAYAPVTILISERADGVHLAYDLMASLLAPYENEKALKVAKALDVKIETLLSAIAE